VVRSPPISAVHRARSCVAGLIFVQGRLAYPAAVPARLADRSVSFLIASAAGDRAITPISPGSVHAIHRTVVNWTLFAPAVRRTISATILRRSCDIPSLGVSACRCTLRNTRRAWLVPVAPVTHLTRNWTRLSSTLLVLKKRITNRATVLRGKKDVASSKALTSTTSSCALTP